MDLKPLFDDEIETKLNTDNKQEEFWKACEEGNIEIVQNLLDDPDVDPTILIENKDKDGTKENRALLSACQHGHLPIVRVLLADSRIDPTDSNVIRIAIENDHPEIIVYLLNDTRINPGDSIQYAVANDNVPIAQLLLRDSRTTVTFEAVANAIKEGNQELIRLLLLDPRLTLTPYKYSRLLEKAVETNDTEIVQTLLRDLPDTTDIWSALSTAVENGSLDVVRMLLNDPRADPSECDSDLLLVAHEKGYKEIQALLECDPRVDKNVLRSGEIAWENYFIPNIIQIKQVLFNCKPEAGVNKQRKFTETVEIQISLRNYDPSRDKRLNYKFYVPHEIRQCTNVVIFGNDQDCSEAKKNGIPYYTVDDLKSFNKDKKKIKKAFKKKKLVILASTSIIRTIPRLMGPQLGKMNRFPGVLEPGIPLYEQVEHSKKKITILIKKLPVIHSALGSVNLTVDQLMENLQVCIIELGNKRRLKNGWETVDKIILKSSMGSPACIYNYSDWFSEKKETEEVLPPDQ